MLDYVEYAQRKNIKYSPMSDHAITVAELEEIAKDSGITFRPGDILLLRVGWTKWYDEHDDEDRAKYVTNAYAWAGIKGCEETLEWLWDHHFAAVASDNNGVEVVPMDDEWRELLPSLVPLLCKLTNAQGFTISCSPAGVCQWGKCGTWRS